MRTVTDASGAVVSHAKVTARETQTDAVQDSANIGIPRVNVNQFTGCLAGININDDSSSPIGCSASLPWLRTAPRGLDDSSRAWSHSKFPRRQLIPSKLGLQHSERTACKRKFPLDLSGSKVLHSRSEVSI